MNHMKRREFLIQASVAAAVPGMASPQSESHGETTTEKSQIAIPAGYGFQCPNCDRVLAVATEDIFLGDEYAMKIRSDWLMGSALECPDCRKSVVGPVHTPEAWRPLPQSIAGIKLNH